LPRNVLNVGNPSTDYNWTTVLMCLQSDHHNEKCY